MNEISVKTSNTVRSFGEGRTSLDPIQAHQTQPGKTKTDQYFYGGTYFSSLHFQFLDTGYYYTFIQHMIP